MQEVWRCEGKKVFLQPNSVKRLKGEDYEEKDYFDSYCGNDDYYDRMWEKTIRITS